MKQVSSMRRRLRKLQKKKIKEKWERESAGKACNKCGKCCLGFHIPIGNQEADMKKYFEYHENCEIIKYEDKEYIHVKSRCNHLKEDNTCAIYPDRPRVCKVAYTKIREGFIFPEGCSLK